MPFGSRFGKVGQWWRDRSSLEQILMCVTMIATIIIIILAVRPHHGIEVEGKSCNTAVCMKEAAFILEHVEPNTKPCDDFYKFSCGNFSNYQDEYESLEADVVGSGLLIEMYKEPILESDHKMVKAFKKLFQSCMKDDQREQEELNVLKEILKQAGGWPVLEGDNWDEANFNWIKSTYKLRELGYYYRIFLDFLLMSHPENTTVMQLMVTSPPIDDSSYGVLDLNKVTLMQEVASLFGVKDVNKIYAELDDVHRFAQQLENHNHPSDIHYDDKEAFKEFTVDEYQQRCQSVNWLELLNNIVGPVAKLTKDDSVRFAPPKNLTDWFNLISRTPKRTQANYMMWRVIEETIPFLTKEVTENMQGLSRRETSEYFCMGVAEAHSFTSSPIIVMMNRRYVSAEKKKQLEEMLENIKQELVHLLNGIEWVDTNNKQVIVDKIKTMEMLIAQPKNYLNENVLDDMDVDMVETKKEDFLSLIAQSERNLISTTFAQIGKAPSVQDEWFLTYDGRPMYIENWNALFVPAVITKISLFNENRPHYLNYGAMGYVAGKKLLNVVYDLVKDSNETWSSNIKQTFLDKKSCIEKELGNNKVDVETFTFSDLTYQTISELISYSAYEKWTKKNGDELSLISVPYTPKQLFWISVGSTVCQANISSTLFSTTIGGNKHFENDFGCPANSKINPFEVCHLF